MIIYLISLFFAAVGVVTICLVRSLVQNEAMALDIGLQAPKIITPTKAVLVIVGVLSPVINTAFAVSLGVLFVLFFFHVIKDRHL